MLARARSRLSYANLMATVAVFVALGGTGYAVTQIDAASVGTKQLKKNAVVSKKVKNGSLLSKDFKAGQLPAGATGPAGPQGLPGPKGDNGTNGTNGTDGSNGTNGTQGEPGPLVETLPSGKTLRGAWGFGGFAAAAGHGREAAISYPFPLATSPTIRIVQLGGIPPSQCPGTVTNPQAQAGNLCVYVRLANSTGNIGSYGPEDITGYKFGAVLYYYASGAGNTEAAGTWAVTAP
jgi:hypothetical protein